MRDKIIQEQEQCLILNRHCGEAGQAELLDRYWRAECPECPAKCFWFDGMKMEEADT